MWPLVTLLAEESKLHLLLQSSSLNTLLKLILQRQMKLLKKKTSSLISVENISQSTDAYLQVFPHFIPSDLPASIVFYTSSWYSYGALGICHSTWHSFCMSYIFHTHCYVPLIFPLSMWPFLSTLPVPSLYRSPFCSPLPVRLYSFLVILLDFCSFRSLYPLIMFSHLISSLFCDLPVYLTFSPSSDVLSEEKVFILPFVIFRLTICVCTLSILLIFSVFIRFTVYLFCVPAWSSTHLCVLSYLLLLFCLLSIDIILPYPSDFPRHFPSVHLSNSVYLPPVLVLTYTHHTLIQHFLSIMSYWDFYWNFIPWVISVRHCWQRTVPYLMLCHVLCTYGV